MLGQKVIQNRNKLSVKQKPNTLGKEQKKVQKTDYRLQTTEKYFFKVRGK